MSSTVQIELDSITEAAQQNGVKSDIPLCEISDSTRLNDVHDDDKVDQVQKWNEPRINVIRLAAACWGFMIMGMNDAAIGVLRSFNISIQLTSAGFDSIRTLLRAKGGYLTGPSSRSTTTSPTR
jgi:hypothetical protein